MLVAAWIIAFLLAQQIAVFLAQPLVTAWDHHKANLGGAALHFNALIEPFWTYMNLAFWVAIVAVSPVLFYKLWRAATRVRAPESRSMALPFTIAAVACFAIGAAFCYVVVLPLAFDFFLGYANQNLSAMKGAFGTHFQLSAPVALRPALYIDPYLSLTSRLMIAFGLVFELPIVVVFLASVGLITHRHLWRFNRWAIVICFIVAAVLTPGPDVISQISMAIPLVTLYNLSIGLAWLFGRRRARRLAAAAAAADPGPTEGPGS